MLLRQTVYEWSRNEPRTLHLFVSQTEGHGSQLFIFYGLEERDRGGILIRSGGVKVAALLLLISLRGAVHDACVESQL